MLAYDGPYGSGGSTRSRYTLHQFDLADPSAPGVQFTRTEFVPTGSTGAVLSLGGIVYAACPSRFWVVDAFTGHVVGATDFRSPSASMAEARDQVLVAGAGLIPVDVADPTEPRPGPLHAVFGEAVAVAPYGDDVLVLEVESARRTTRLRHVRHLGAGVEVARTWSLGSSGPSSALDVAVVDDHAVILSGDRMHVVDLTDPSAERALAALGPEFERAQFRHVVGMPDGRHAIATVGFVNRESPIDCPGQTIGLEVVDVSRPADPSRAAVHYLCFDESWVSVSPTGLTTTGPYAVLGLRGWWIDAPNEYTNGGTLVALDVSEPASPREVARLTHAGWPVSVRMRYAPSVFGIAADERFVYVSGTDSSFAVLEIAPDGSWRTVGTAPDLKSATNMAVHDGQVYAANARWSINPVNQYRGPGAYDTTRSPGALSRVDVSQPHAPALVAKSDQVHALDLAVAAGRLWVAAGVDGLAWYGVPHSNRQ
jgi:hypothetical protein